jgi:hypothetical protein
MSAPQQGHAGSLRSWPWAAGVGLVAGLLLVWGFNLRATEGSEKGKEDPQKAEKGKDEAPANPERPRGANAPLRQTMKGQMELMQEMLKAMKEPGGPTPESLFRMMDRMMPLLDPGALDMLPVPPPLPALPHAGDAAYISKRLGVQAKPASDDVSELLDIPRGQGQVVIGVFIESPAAAAGLKPSDILLELNNKAVSKVPAEFVRALEDIKDDVPVNVVVLRKGTKKEIKGLKLREAPPPGPVLPRVPPPPRLP